MKDNQQLTQIVSKALEENHFTNIHTDSTPNLEATSVFDLVRSFNPDFFDTLVCIVSQPLESYKTDTPFNFSAIDKPLMMPYGVM